MPVFFTQPTNTLIAAETTLASYQATKRKFDPKDVLHNTLVSNCAAAVREKLSVLQSTDIKMTSGFALGTAALLLSYVLPFSLVATVAFAYGAYQLAKRQQAYADYKHALENLSKCCIWTLGEVNQDKVKAHEVTQNEAIHDMMITLAPLTSAQQLRDFIDDTVEDELIDEANKVKAQVMVFDHHLDKEKMDLYFKIYGYNQGGFLAIFEGLGFAIKNGFNSFASYVSSIMPGKSTPNSESVGEAKPAPTEEPEGQISAAPTV
jgi:hypothetical protein